ncbi:GNAT family N-acetyltransferase [Herbihabitans rhizosphaerae]|uniref:GNAT family N-acetyltransferase n=1 Tax=Herbihabitans rhizosphaerae TaxID=1872711 RepID=UPI00102C21D7|nr:GNAT family N-acetyltransferase [Herbihabitans rhizosphaerae]
MDNSDFSGQSVVANAVRVRVDGASSLPSYVDRVAALYASDFSASESLQEYSANEERIRKKLLDDYSTDPRFKGENVPDPTFRIVTVWSDQDEILGFVYGAALSYTTRWWANIHESLSAEFTQEDGRRTLALFDICVKADARGRGLASLLHASLLRGRIEARVTLQCSNERYPAYPIWRHWGYQKVGTTTSRKDGKVRHVLIRDIACRTNEDAQTKG